MEARSSEHALPIVTVERAHAAYPPALALDSEAPARLHVRGTMPSARPQVAIVGSRAASARGVARACELARALAKKGMPIVSGGAVGIDAAAHRGALEGCGPTVAVLASGLRDPYPRRHAPLFEAIVTAGGALVSTLEDGGSLRRWHFPKRNGVIAGLVDAVLIVEAQATSGSLYTAAAARRLGRVLCACPGSPGTTMLLAQGAALVESAEDVSAALAGAPRAEGAPPPEAGSDEERVLFALDATTPRSAEAVGAASGLAAERAAMTLVSLELSGHALATPGGRYVRAAGRLSP